jgi:type II secretory pathway component PulK
MKMRWFTPTHALKRRRPATGAAKRPEAEVNQRRGVALIMVLVITTVMGAISADLTNEAKVNLRAAANARDQLQAYYHARSAVELELFILRFQGQVKSLVEQFVPVPLFEMSSFLVSSDTMKGVLAREPLPRETKTKDSYAFDKPFGDFEGSFWIDEIVDENRKINVNNFDLATTGNTSCTNLPVLLFAGMIDNPKYDPLFESLFDTHDPLKSRIDLIANITDWVDGNQTVDPVCQITGDQSQSGAAEDTRYERLPYNARYKPKNGQFNSLAELRMVPGVNDAFMRLFSKYLTVWSDNKAISMKTADQDMIRAVIMAILPTGGALNWQSADEERFQKFLQAKALMMAMPPPMNAMSQQVFTTLLDQTGIKYDPGKLAALKDYLRYDDISRVYRVTAVGRVHDAQATIILVWRDDGNFGELFYWREE